MSNRFLTFSAVIEIITGLSLLIVPSLVGQLLFGIELTSVAITVAGITGIALLSLGVACWPGTPLIGMTIYNVGVALYLSYIGITAITTGLLLWPAVVVHLFFAVILIRTAAGDRNR